MKTYEKGISLSIWTLSWPIFIEVFLQMLVGNIDQLMMSHYSPQAVAAVANANQILNIFIMLIVVMSTATTILIAQYLGARNQSKLSEVCTVSLVLNFVFSSVAAVNTKFSTKLTVQTSDNFDKLCILLCGGGVFHHLP